MRDRHLYAPMSGVGGILYDNDAVYIDVNEGGVGAENQRKRANIEDEEEEQQIMDDIMTSKGNYLDEQLKDSEIKLYKHSKPEKSDHQPEAKRRKVDVDMEKKGSYSILK